MDKPTTSQRWREFRAAVRATRTFWRQRTATPGNLTMPDPDHLDAETLARWAGVRPHPVTASPNLVRSVSGRMRVAPPPLTITPRDRGFHGFNTVVAVPSTVWRRLYRLLDLDPAEDPETVAHDVAILRDRDTAARAATEGLLVELCQAGLVDEPRGLSVPSAVAVFGDLIGELREGTAADAEQAMALGARVAELVELLRQVRDTLRHTDDLDPRLAGLHRQVDRVPELLSLDLSPAPRGARRG